jgi:membrane-associated phospholipid phosphatase
MLPGPVLRSRRAWTIVLAICAGSIARPLPAADFSGNPGGAEGLRSFEVVVDDGVDDEIKLEYKPIVGISLFAGTIASVALPLELHKMPPACRWCGGLNPNAIDRWARHARWQEPCRAAKLSYWSLGVASAMALGPMSHDSRKREWLANAGAVVDAAAVTVMATQVAKYVVRRERPASNPCLIPNGDEETDRNLSFFSGHTALAFAVAASARETSRLRGRSNRDWLWLSGASAALTGYLRVAGDRHHLTDVIAGAGVGVLIGTWVPRHLHRPKAVPAPDAPTVERRAAPPPLIGITRSMDAGGRRYVVQLGKGPGKSVQFGLTF